MTPTSDTGGLGELATMPIVAHPLRMFLVARDIPLGTGAALLGVSARQLCDWLAYRSRPSWWRAAEIARALQIVDPDDLFPRR